MRPKRLKQPKTRLSAVALLNILSTLILFFFTFPHLFFFSPPPPLTNQQLRHIIKVVTHPKGQPRLHKDPQIFILAVPDAGKSTLVQYLGEAMEDGV